MIQVTKHAELRYRQRVDPGEPFPCERVRELFERAERDDEADVDEGIAYRAGEALLVKKGEAVATILHAERRAGR